MPAIPSEEPGAARLLLPEGRRGDLRPVVRIFRQAGFGAPGITPGGGYAGSGAGDEGLPRGGYG